MPIVCQPEHRIIDSGLFSVHLFLNCIGGLLISGLFCSIIVKETTESGYKWCALFVIQRTGSHELL